MLFKPSIIKLPESAFPVTRTTGCQSYTAPQNGYRCRTAFSCQPYAYNSDSCVDCDYTTCSYTLGMGVLATGVTIGGAAAGIIT